MKLGRRQKAKVNEGVESEGRLQFYREDEVGLPRSRLSTVLKVK